jgi:hypothetical protein
LPFSSLRLWRTGPIYLLPIFSAFFPALSRNWEYSNWRYLYSFSWAILQVIWAWNPLIPSKLMRRWLVQWSLVWNLSLAGCRVIFESKLFPH